MFLIFDGEVICNMFCVIDFAEGDGGAAEAAAGHAAAKDAMVWSELASEVDHEVEFFAGHLEMIAE